MALVEDIPVLRALESASSSTGGAEMRAYRLDTVEDDEVTMMSSLQLPAAPGAHLLST